MLFAFPAIGDAGSLLVPILLLVVIVLATAAWVYTDAKASAGRGRPIVSSVGSVRLSTPIAWFVACVLLWEFCFPLYIDSRSLL